MKLLQGKIAIRSCSRRAEQRTRNVTCQLHNWVNMGLTLSYCHLWYLWPLLHHKKSCSGKVVTSCIGSTMPCIPENFKRKTVSLWDHFILTQRHSGQNAYGIHVPLERLSHDSKTESRNHTTRRREGEPPPVACGKRREGKKSSHHIPGIHVQHEIEKAFSFGIHTPLTLRCERVYWDPWKG
jgi:hypothetical protein